jgi:hypothetical protein
MMTISVTGAKDLPLALQTVAEPLPASSSPNFAGRRRPNSDKPEINPPFRADIKRLREFIERNASKAALKIADILLAEAGSFFQRLLRQTLRQPRRAKLRPTSLRISMRRMIACLHTSLLVDLEI